MLRFIFHCLFLIIEINSRLYNNQNQFLITTGNKYSIKLRRDEEPPNRDEEPPNPDKELVWVNPVDLCVVTKLSGCYHGGDFYGFEMEYIYPTCWRHNYSLPWHWDCYHYKDDGKCEEEGYDITKECQFDIKPNFFWYEGQFYDGVDFLQNRTYIPAVVNSTTGRGTISPANDKRDD